VIGNMCRHSAYFYPQLVSAGAAHLSHCAASSETLAALPVALSEQHRSNPVPSVLLCMQGPQGILDALIRCCADPDRNTRKFACFAEFKVLTHLPGRTP